MRHPRERRESPRLVLLTGGKENAMSDPTTTTPTPEAPPAAETPPKHRPKLTSELRDLEKQLRADAPDEVLRFGTCEGTSQAPHPQELWVTFMQPSLCPSCSGPRETWPLEKEE